MNEITALDKLVIEINFYSQQSAQSIIEVGKRLIQAKAQVPHGEWGGWLKDKVNYTERTAQRCIKCAERFGNTTTSSYLNPSSMWMRTMSPSTKSLFVERG